MYFLSWPKAASLAGTSYGVTCSFPTGPLAGGAFPPAEECRRVAPSVSFFAARLFRRKKKRPAMRARPTTGPAMAPARTAGETVMPPEEAGGAVVDDDGAEVPVVEEVKPPRVPVTEEVLAAS